MAGSTAFKAGRDARRHPSTIVIELIRIKPKKRVKAAGSR